MKTVAEKSEISKLSRQWQGAGKTVGFVPTMGALHAGHLKLVKAAKEACDKVIVSIFVNPKQFGPKEDFARYPRPIEDDTRLLEAAGVDCLFAPSVDEMYPADMATVVSVSSLSKILCGKTRPIFFDGVCTVVTKLFHILMPNYAFFGKKDFQQFTILNKMAQDLDFQVTLIGVETEREPDGLAMSSRNRYLTAEERAIAPLIFTTFQKLKKAYADGCHNAPRLTSIFAKTLNHPLCELEYCEIRCPHNLDLIEGDFQSPAQVLVAVRIGPTRLIDNFEL